MQLLSALNTVKAHAFGVTYSLSSATVWMQSTQHYSYFTVKWYTLPVGCMQQFQGTEASPHTGQSDAELIVCKQFPYIKYTTLTERHTFNVAKSCVPMATRERCLQRFACNLSCRSMKLLYRALSKWIPRSTAATANGRTRAVSGLMVSCRGCFPACHQN